MTTAQSAPHAIGFADHLKFFDLDGDDHISLSETHLGLHRLGLGYALTLPGAVVVNVGVAALGLSQARSASPTRLPIPQTGMVRHPDSELVDDEGRFRTERLDAVFDQYGSTFAGEALTAAEVARMAASRVRGDAKAEGASLVMTAAGFVGAALEWGVLFWVARGEREGRAVLEKEAVLRFFTDSSFFDDVASRLEQQRIARSKTLGGRTRNLLQSLVL